MKILALSDVELQNVYSPIILQRHSGTDMVISCGDLHFDYLEYVVSMLNVPLYYVRGNHAYTLETESGETHHAPGGASNLHQKVLRDPTGLLLAGIEGCVQYNDGPYQYSQGQMWTKVLGLVPGLLINHALYGRYLDLFITHAPPWKIHDMDDRPHQGIKAFRWLVETFQPAYHLHGHIHVYRQDTVRVSWLGSSCVMNVFGSQEIHLEPVLLAGRNLKTSGLPLRGRSEK
jgi:hypothetical protein